MSILLFMLGFVVISRILLEIVERRLIYGIVSISPNEVLEYIVTGIKGSVRGSMGMLESNSMLETKRAALKMRNSKF